MAIAQFKRRLAGGSRPPEDSVLFLARDVATLEKAGGVIDRLLAGKWRLSVVLVAPGDQERLKARFPAACPRRPWLPMGGALGFAALATLRVRSACLIDPETLGGPEAVLAAAIHRRGVPVFKQNTNPSEALSGTAADALAEQLVRGIGVEREPTFSLDRLSAKFSRSGTGPTYFPWVRRLSSLQMLAERLGQPKNILCIGNGPSGRNPALAGLEHDAVFRVNHDWRANGLLEKPDMVFAGVKRSMRKFSDTPIGVATERKAHALLACRGFEPWHGRAEFAVVDQIAHDLIPIDTGPLRPTTGAYMLACAIALSPDELIIAGMDMFRHPEGAYAGDAPEINAYTPSHSFETDAAFIRHCLAQYRGTVLSYSDAFSATVRDIAGNERFSLVEAAGLQT